MWTQCENIERSACEPSVKACNFFSPTKIRRCCVNIASVSVYLILKQCQGLRPWAAHTYPKIMGILLSSPRPGREIQQSWLKGKNGLCSGDAVCPVQSFDSLCKSCKIPLIKKISLPRLNLLYGFVLPSICLIRVIFKYLKGYPRANNSLVWMTCFLSLTTWSGNDDCVVTHLPESVPVATLGLKRYVFVL